MCLYYSLVLLAFPIISSAWSSSGGGTSNRRLFLENTAKQTSAAVLIGSSSFTENAEATADSWSHDKGSVYDIPPGSLSGQGNYLCCLINLSCLIFILYISCALFLRNI